MKTTSRRQVPVLMCFAMPELTKVDFSDTQKVHHAMHLLSH